MYLPLHRSIANFCHCLPTLAVRAAITTMPASDLHQGATLHNDLR